MLFNFLFIYFFALTELNNWSQWIRGPEKLYKTHLCIWRH